MPTWAGGWREFKVLLEEGSLDILQPNATKGGGISDTKLVQHICLDSLLSFSSHTWTNGLGFLINLHVYVCGLYDYPLGTLSDLRDEC